MAEHTAAVPPETSPMASTEQPKERKQTMCTTKCLDYRLPDRCLDELVVTRSSKYDEAPTKKPLTPTPQQAPLLRSYARQPASCSDNCSIPGYCKRGEPLSIKNPTPI
ncbi:UNVERIFIED_CONTAM: hypothetical protein HHA_449080 [Hammondia hammondi]|eukprot:XP_008881656.1 hypothetical protein HHA_449080 [Hammondia hammondi]